MVKMHLKMIDLFYNTSFFYIEKLSCHFDELKVFRIGSNLSYLEIYQNMYLILIENCMHLLYLLCTYLNHIYFNFWTVPYFNFNFMVIQKTKTV